MTVNSDKPERWKADIAKSVDLYNQWFIRFAPKTYRETRLKATKAVQSALEWTNDLRNISEAVLRQYPTILPMLRMTTAPPIARDRLVGLAQVPQGLVYCIECKHQLPPRMEKSALKTGLEKIAKIITQLADKDIFPWLEQARKATKEENYRAATIIADRLCGAEADPIVRNAQEQRQLEIIKKWLENKQYSYVKNGTGLTISNMKPGTFAFRLNVPIKLSGGEKRINIPIDIAIMPKNAKSEKSALLVEAKSAGDFTNTNKRRKEEAMKIAQLRATYGSEIRFILFLCGYFDSGYLGYEAAEGIDWVWEHRIDDIEQFGI